MMEKLAKAGEGGGCTPTPFHYIYHHVHSCGVRLYGPAERADTLYPYMYSVAEISVKYVRPKMWIVDKICPSD
jgi:hypothetical protein